MLAAALSSPRPEWLIEVMLTAFWRLKADERPTSAGQRPTGTLVPRQMAGGYTATASQSQAGGGRASRSPNALAVHRCKSRPRQSPAIAPSLFARRQVMRTQTTALWPFGRRGEMAHHKAAGR